MYIRVTRQQTGRQMQEEIYARHGGPEAVEAAAAAGDADAEYDLWWLHVLGEDPNQLDEPLSHAEVYELEPEEVRLLTGTRLALLETLVGLGSATVSELQRATGRDYKRVQRDLDTLERLGVIRSFRVGRKRIVRPLGDELTIKFVRNPVAVAAKT